MKKFLNWYESQSVEDQDYIVKAFAALPAQFISYKILRKLGAPRWAAYSLSGIGVSVNLAPARHEYEQRRRQRQAAAKAQAEKIRDAVDRTFSRN